ncbi:hypothetical protein RFUL19S_01191 [Rhizobacter fulvus]
MGRSYEFTEKRHQKWLDQGRGTGEGPTWVPWLQKADFSSRGKATIDSLKGENGREVHVFSALERLAWMVYICKCDVLGIEEQFPLDRDMTREIAASLGVRHPCSEVDIVMTTDLLVRVRRPDGTVQRHARSVKPSRDFGNHNHMEHAEIERRYHLAQGHSFAVLTESSFSRELARNIDILYMHRDAHSQSEPLDYAGSYQYVEEVVRGAILSCNSNDARLFAFCTKLNESRSWPPGLATRVALNLIRWHKLSADYGGTYLGDQSVLAIAQKTRAREAQSRLEVAA